MIRIIDYCFSLIFDIFRLIFHKKVHRNQLTCKFAGLIAHKARNPLVKIKSFCKVYSNTSDWLKAAKCSQTKIMNTDIFSKFPPTL
jgi:hypothetical protein